MRKRLRTMLVRRVIVHIDVYSEEVSLRAGRDHALGRRSSITAAVAHQSQQVQLHQTPLGSLVHLADHSDCLAA
jgi:hypothetical protein